MKVATVVGTRPQFIKVAPVSRALEAAGIDEVLIHTGQHFDAELSTSFFSELGLPTPDHQLDIHGGTYGSVIGRSLEAVESVLRAEDPDLVMVYGDTNATLAGALAAAITNIKLVHVEAGLRSFDRTMREEQNRVVCDHLSHLLFCPTTTAVDNLREEGIRQGVHLVGDVMYDAALLFAERARTDSNILTKLGFEGRPFTVATVHRAENTDDPCRLERILRYLKEASETDVVVFPVHPRTRKAVRSFGLDLDGLMAIDPIGYLDMTRLLQKCRTVYTDSGGLQKEAYFHRVPCVTLREETEWVETIECGWNRLWTTDSYRERRDISEYGDGRASTRIAEILASPD